MRWAWLIGAALVAVAALSVWWAFQSPQFVAALSAIAAGLMAKAIVTKVAARKPKAEEDYMNAEIRAGRGDEYQKDWMRRRTTRPEQKFKKILRKD